MMTVGAQEQAAADAIEEAVARTGMSAERWMPPTSAAQAASVQEDPSCGCGAEVQEALSPPIPTHLPGQIVFRIHGMDCADEIAALKREVGPLVGEDKLGFDLLNGRMSIDVTPDAALRSEERRVGKECVRTCKYRGWPRH